MNADPSPAARRRDSAATRQRLLDAAGQRFARHGYAATTVRDIADRAGVNVALINRYFTSKEGLFEACLVGAADDLTRTVGENVSIDLVADSMARHLAGPSADRQVHQILMLLRTSGDARADRLRLDRVRVIVERVAAAAGWHPDHPDGDRLLLGAEIALATVLGLAMLRVSMPLEPLAAAGQDDLAAPFHRLLHALLTAPARPRE
ncbi:MULTISPECIES: TetR/AcrR family transcriptional regulator [Catenuloplanes]|uniref:AcrR family transcriptional regulator n=1 Tax=Catenuloplanes niger TaxID=587534 RepID=A0AAE3ZX93_9ACTN|nr:TetR family transcriptional regulator [Catenuloplanes niger]MDR7327708.1 AcrR family transcriptional regulator [Catenuloplanes niger]